jgi:ribosomal protein L30/L7E
MRRSIAERVSKHRAALRAAGLRPIQIWVPDTKKKGFAAECRRQCLRLRDDPAEKEIMEWIEKVADLTGWEWDGDL